MAGSPTAPTLAQGLLLLLLLLYSWGPYTWVGNLVRADVGLVRAATLVAMAAIFVVALVLPDAWKQGPGLLDAPLALALAAAGRPTRLGTAEPGVNSGPEKTDVSCRHPRWSFVVMLYGDPAAPRGAET
ncbi:low temperature requirement protein A [Micromonospora zamorensis]|uniref:low temperature requirement protein A n=1 Tax=Micromonospora zamorensis TaxID=709883 RepID=UPI0034068648